MELPHDAPTLGLLVGQTPQPQVAPGEPPHEHLTAAYAHSNGRFVLPPVPPPPLAQEFPTVGWVLGQLAQLQFPFRHWQVCVE